MRRAHAHPRRTSSFSQTCVVACEALLWSLVMSDCTLRYLVSSGSSGLTACCETAAMFGADELLALAVGAFDQNRN